ncbi:hypothetical protein [Blastopirellula marina]|uniref:Uncharacterized protein n=1 Tax=Blastopirellula marina TaxID=124 RepID=A0A2S8GTJ4_9BACT|nr:hypothetical protein [Blastopirellula marina]PQO47732.1 hypothetical protein C5Y93_03495 [Blastopirellula marina]
MLETKRGSEPRVTDKAAIIAPAGLFVTRDVAGPIRPDLYLYVAAAGEDWMSIDSTGVSGRATLSGALFFRVITLAMT